MPAGGWAVAALTAAWTAAVAAAWLGDQVAPGALGLALLPPLALAAAVALGERRPGDPVLLATAWAAAVGGAVLVAVLLLADPRIALVVPALAIAAFVCARRPAAAVVAAFVLTGAFNTLEVLTPIPVGETVDLLLAGLWIAAIWRYAVTRRERPLWLWPGVAAALLYLLLTAVQALATESAIQGLYAFRITAWYMAALVLVGYSGWSAGTLRAIARGVVVAALAVGAYATFRWIAGPSAAEEEAALGAFRQYNLVDGDVRLFGSFPSGHQLAGWTGIVAPFCLAAALVWRGRWRLAAALATGLCLAALLGSEVRAGLVAVAAGMVVVVVLHQLARGFPGPRLGTAAAAVVGCVAAGVAAFTIAFGGSEEATARYTAILDPTGEPSVQRRLDKWSEAVAVVRESPFGQGLGSSGQAHTRYGRFETLASFDLDNSYLKVAVDQGPAMLLLFCAASLLLLYGLVSRALRAPDGRAAAMAIGAAGAFTAFLLVMVSGLFIEGLPALAAWMLVGLGIAHFATPKEVE